MAVAGIGPAGQIVTTKPVRLIGLLLCVVLVALTLTGCRNTCGYQPEDYTPICRPNGKWIPKG